MDLRKTGLIYDEFRSIFHLIGVTEIRFHKKPLKQQKSILNLQYLAYLFSPNANDTDQITLNEKRK